MKLIPALLALGIAGLALAACEAPRRDVLARAPMHYTPTDERVMMHITARQSGDLTPGW